MSAQATYAPPPADVGVRPIRGPSALGGGAGRFFSLMWTLAVLEFKLKFFGSVLGYLWQLMKPLMLFGVLYVVFTEFVRFGAGVDHYPVVLLTGIVVFTFFAEATSGAVTCVVDRENLVRKIHFPRMVIPLSVVLTAYFNFLLNFVAVLIFMLASGVGLRLEWLEIVPLMLLLGAFCTGLGMLLSALYVRYRDMRPIWDVLLQVTFYGTPILYAYEQVADSSETLAELMMWNPLASVIEQIRHALIDPGAPSAAEAIGGSVMLLIPLGIVLAACLLGFRVFNREAPHIAEDL